MMARMKSLFSILMILIMVSLCPAIRVLADETKGTYSEEVPYLEGIEFNMLVNLESNRGYGEDLVMQDKDVSSFIFKFDKLDGIEYENYEVVFDMVLKSQLSDGKITTYEYKKSFDVSKCKPGFFDSWDSFWMNLTQKDMFYKVSMDFGEIVQNSPDCIVEEKWVSDGLNFTVKKINIYNTVISQIDCYLREKNTGNNGLLSRFILTWDSDFYKSLCTNITYNLVVPETGDILNSGSITNNSGSYGYDSSGDNWFYNTSSLLSRFTNFLTDVPNALYVLVTNTYTVSSKLLELLKVVFPFVPSVILGAVAVLFIYIIIVSLWKLFKG